MLGRPWPATERRVQVKGMLYNDPGSIKGAQRDPQAIAHQWAERIYRLNHGLEFAFLHITSLDKLKVDVHSLLLKCLKAGQGFSDREIH